MADGITRLTLKGKGEDFAAEQLGFPLLVGERLPVPAAVKGAGAEDPVPQGKKLRQ